MDYVLNVGRSGVKIIVSLHVTEELLDALEEAESEDNVSDEPVSEEIVMAVG
jgi:hypothetical protein